MKQLLTALVVVVVLGSCAKAPEAIMASYISDVPYRSWACQDLGEETIRLNQALATASTQQSNARSGDVASVILLGIPASSFSGGNIAPEVARLKGETEAVNRAMRMNSCGGQIAMITPPPEPAKPRYTPAGRAALQ